MDMPTVVLPLSQGHYKMTIELGMVYSWTYLAKLLVDHHQVQEEAPWVVTSFLKYFVASARFIVVVSSIKSRDYASGA